MWRPLFFVIFRPPLPLLVSNLSHKWRKFCMTDTFLPPLEQTSYLDSPITVSFILKGENVSDKYWEFSWNEIGSYDLPAFIDTVLAKTAQKSLHYIGHSQGTTSFFVMLSMYPEYNDKIRSFHGMAPVMHINHPCTLCQFLGMLSGNKIIVTY